MFKGFTDSESFTSVPDTFFRKLMKEIQDVNELKVTLWAIWRIAHMESHLHVLQESDFSECVTDSGPGLQKSIDRGTLLRVDKRGETYYFLNSPRGRAAAQAYEQGTWKPRIISPALPEQPNIFQLYEENIGPLTPLLADVLRDAEQAYPTEWIGKAFILAVKSNKRSWRYVEAILRRWKEEGYEKKQDRRDAQEVRGRDVTRKVEDFLKK